MELINQSINELYKEIEKVNQGLEAIDGLRELNYILASLKRAEEMLASDTSEEITKPNLNIARLVIDTWPLESELRHKLCEIEHQYTKIKM